MAYRLIYSEFWTDPKVMEEMTPEDRYFYLYLLTNRSTTYCGIYLITKKQMAFELGYSIEAVNSLIDRFVNHHGLIVYNPETRELAIKNWGKYNLKREGKLLIDCLSSELSKIKDKTLINYVLENISNDTIKNLYGSFCDSPTNRGGDVERQGDNTNTYTNTYTNTERDIDLNKSTEGHRNAKGFRNKGSAEESDREVKSDNDIHSLSISLLQEHEKLTLSYVNGYKQNMLDYEYYKRHLWKYQGCEVLLVDDLFKGKINETDISIVFEILNYRYLKFLSIDKYGD